MKKSRNALSMALVLTLLLSIGIMGCSKTPDVTKDSTSAEQLSTSVDTKLEPVELTYYFCGSYPQPKQDIVYAKLSELTKAKINATVKFNPFPWGDYDQKMKVLIASGESVDVAFSPSWANSFITNQAKGALLPLDGLLAKYAPKTYAQVPVKFWDSVKIKGKIYAVLNYQISARSALFNVEKGRADKYGFTLNNVKKLEDFEPFLKTVKEKEPNSIPFYSYWENANYEVYYGMESVAATKIPGAIYINESATKVFNQFESAEYKDYINRQARWNKEGYLHGSDMITVKDTTSLQVANKIAAGMGGTYKPGVEAEEEAKTKHKSYFKIASEAIVNTGALIPTVNSIYTSSKNPERAMMFIELLNSDKEVYNMLSHGIEGVHYTKLDGEYIEPVKDSGYNPGTDWLFGCNFNSYLLKGQAADTWEQTRKLNESAKVSQLMGFSFDPGPVNSEIAQCTAVYDEFSKAFDFGVADINTYYPKFIDKLKKAGSDKIITEIQKQIDAWKATK